MIRIMVSMQIFWLVAAAACSPFTQVTGFVPHHQQHILIRHVPCHHSTFRPIKPRRALSQAKQDDFDGVPHEQANDHRSISNEKILSAQRIMGVMSAAAWILM